MVRGLKGRGSRLDERTISGRPSRGLLSPAGAIALAARAWRRRKAGEEEDGA